MRTSGIVSLLLLMALLACSVHAEMLLRMHSKEEHKIKLAVKRLRDSLFADTDLDGETQACLQQGAKTCSHALLPQLQAMSQQARIQFANTIAQQSNAFETWLNQQGANVTPAAVFQYFDQNLSNDPVTG